MCVVVYLLCSLLVLVASAPNEKPFYHLNDAEHHFDQFIVQFNRKYENALEKQKRFEIFKQNLQLINQHNMKNSSTINGINDFTDLTSDEFKRYHTCHMTNKKGMCSPKALQKNLVNIPDSFDWRDKNAVTRVKNQQSCGSCWAFSTTGTVEGKYAIKHNELQEFSEQQLVDCDRSNGDNGCSGGFMSNALAYFKSKGVMLESDYQYTAAEGECQYDQGKVAAKLTDCYDHTKNNEEDLREVLMTYGPLSIGISASDRFKAYNGGVMELDVCPPGNINHGVLLVGFGEDNGNPYWIVKNSWGTGWGESGYVRMKRNVNICNMMSSEIVSAEVA